MSALAGAVIVSTPQDLALIDARRGIAMFNQVHVPIYGLFENMSYFLCPHCGERTEIFSHGGAKAEAEKMGVPFLGEAPLDAAVRETSDAGLPVDRQGSGFAPGPALSRPGRKGPRRDESGAGQESAAHRGRIGTARPHPGLSGPVASSGMRRALCFH